VPKKRLTAVQRERAAKKLVEAKLRLFTKKAVSRDKEMLERFNRVVDENKLKSEALRDKNAALAARDEQIQWHNKLLARADQHTANIMRVVDQFTSIQIIGHGQHLNASGQGVGVQSIAITDRPASLRNTKVG
jgi:hypothetical protein